MPTAIVKHKGKQYRVTEFGWRMRTASGHGGNASREHVVTTPSGETLVIAPQEFATAEVLSYED